MAGLYLYALYSGVQFAVYPHYARLTGEWHFLTGVLASSTASLCSYPLDVIRTRHSLQRGHRGIGPINGPHAGYGNPWQTAITIIRAEGLSGLYKGLLPTLLQLAPSMGVTFATYHKSKEWLPLDSAKSDVAAGAIAGFCSKAATMPLDVIRKRMQIQGSPYSLYVVDRPPVYASLPSCVGTIWRQEGIRGFYSGFLLSLAKSIPVTATSFLVYGLTKSFLSNKCI